jgi:hypothetical protein
MEKMEKKWQSAISSAVETQMMIYYRDFMGKTLWSGSAVGKRRGQLRRIRQDPMLHV